MESDWPNLPIFTSKHVPTNRNFSAKLFTSTNRTFCCLSTIILLDSLIVNEFCLQNKCEHQQTNYKGVANTNKCNGIITDGRDDMRSKPVLTRVRSSFFR